MTMPNFLLIGAGKSGTTAIYRYLQAHPQIYMSALKEPQFFAIAGQPISDFPDLRGYEQEVVTDLQSYEQLFARFAGEVAIGEASTWYLYNPQALDRIQQSLPNVKLIAILRHPVERAYSHFLFNRGIGREPLSSFETALAVEPERIAQNLSPRFH